MVPKIFIIGAGNVGSAIAAALVSKKIGLIYLNDIIEDLAIGKAMDINQATPFLNSDSRVIGCNTLNELRGSEIVIITAGAPRRKGMKRADLLNENLSIIDKIGKAIIEINPTAIVILITNPTEALTFFLKRKWPAMNIFGLGCTLDTVRFRFFLSEAAGLSIDSASGLVIGAHNDTMIPLIRHATIGGILATSILEEEDIQGIIQQTINAGTNIVHRLKERGSFYAASYVVAQVVESIVFNKLEIFPLSILCNGDYGYKNICLALPVKVGHVGVIECIDIKLNKKEISLLERSAQTIRETIQTL